MVQPARQLFDFADYVLLEEVSQTKHEFLDGVVWAMAGGSPEHARIQVNLSASLRDQLAGLPCAVYSSDLRVRVKATGLGTYPDVTVVCGELELDPEDPKRHTVQNPGLVAEVLSPSTENYDRGEKLEHYRQIASLDTILLVAHDQRRVEVWTRDDGGWKSEVVHGEGCAAVPQLGLRLALADIYRDPLVP